LQILPSNKVNSVRIVGEGSSSYVPGSDDLIYQKDQQKNIQNDNHPRRPIRKRTGSSRLKYSGENSQ